MARLDLHIGERLEGLLVGLIFRVRPVRGVHVDAHRDDSVRAGDGLAATIGAYGEGLGFDARRGRRGCSCGLESFLQCFY